jgi:hypothetical protein
MNADVLTHGTAYRLGENATRPIELRNGTLAALLLLAGFIPRRPRLASALFRSPLGCAQLLFLGS